MVSNLTITDAAMILDFFAACSLKTGSQIDRITPYLLPLELQVAGLSFGPSQLLLLHLAAQDRHDGGPSLLSAAGPGHRCRRSTPCPGHIDCHSTVLCKAKAATTSPG